MSKEFETECVELIKALRYCVVHPFRPCDGCVLFETDGCINVLHGSAADSLEGMQSDLAKKDSQISEWKNAWRIANSLYKSAQSEIDELRAYERELVERIETLKTMQNGEEKHE